MEWPDPTKPYQLVYLIVDKAWSIRLIPSLDSANFGTCELDCEARCVSPPLKDVKAFCSFEVVNPGQHADKKGFGSFTEGSATRPSLLIFNLCCKHTALEWLYRIFLGAFTLPDGYIGIPIQIEPRDPPGEDFWHAPGKREEWVVVGWSLEMNVQRNNP